MTPDTRPDSREPAAELAALAERHKPVKYPRRKKEVCEFDSYLWPCDAARFYAALRATAHRPDELKAALTRYEDRQRLLDDERNPGRNDVQRDLRRIAAVLAAAGDNEVEAPDPLTFSEEYRRGWYAARAIRSPAVAPATEDET